MRYRVAFASYYMLHMEVSQDSPIAHSEGRYTPLSPTPSRFDFLHSCYAMRVKNQRSVDPRKASSLVPAWLVPWIPVGAKTDRSGRFERSDVIAHGFRYSSHAGTSEEALRGATLRWFLTLTANTNVGNQHERGVGDKGVYRPSLWAIGQSRVTSCSPTLSLA